MDFKRLPLLKEGKEFHPIEKKKQVIICIAYAAGLGWHFIEISQIIRGNGKREVDKVM